jgi:hypothetical protein
MGAPGSTTSARAARLERFASEGGVPGPLLQVARRWRIQASDHWIGNSST